ncbi:MAG: MBL fold metallo-hydrolase [Candidatus Bathyarchaeota archaeon]|nr:MBL fold metallo-hydrolase [Candidatus Bathyarchaeota archaeon]
MTPLTLHVLGTGGGRFVMITQRRRTAGIRLVHGPTQVHIDPGPGALVFSNWAGLSPQKLDGLIVTHCHPDHYCDAEVLIEAMSRGATRRRGTLAASTSVIHGNGCGPSISAYHRSRVDRIEALGPGSSFEVGALRFSAVEARHSDPDTVGLRLEADGLGAVGYTSDTGHFPELGGLYEGVRLLVLCTLRPRGHPLRLHLSMDEALEIVERARPGCVVLTHFGMRMLDAGPDDEAAFLQEETGVPAVAARDGMRFTLAEGIEVAGPRKRDGTRAIDA